MSSAPRRRSFLSLHCRLVWAAAFWLSASVSLVAQIPNFNVGPDAGLASIDFAQIYLDQMNRHAREREQQRAQDKELIDSGTVSALDLEAPNNAVDEFNHATSLMKAQHSQEAIKRLQKAIAIYPKFVSAHIGLGLAYLDQEDPTHARSEFETAAKLDPKFPASFLNLGLVALSLNDFATAQPELEKAASLRPNDARILSSLVYAQNGTHQYQDALATTQRVHALNHKGLANVHYVAASAALSLNNLDVMERELNLFLNEDPSNAFAPTARQNLAAVSHNKAVRAAAAANSPQSPTLVASLSPQTFPNSDRLKAQLSAVGDESNGEACDDCGALAESGGSTAAGGTSVASSVPPRSPAHGGAWTLRTDVDQVTMFFSVSSRGH
ncbi:MAG TPA: tetratricopeptide repeat protein, partial [Terracidiphilus sp.]